MEVKLTPADVNKALTQYVSGLFVGDWQAEVVTMHKTGGATVAVEYHGNMGSSKVLHSGVFDLGQPSPTQAREPVLQEAIEDDLLGEEDMEGEGEMVEL